MVEDDNLYANERHYFFRVEVKDGNIIDKGKMYHKPGTYKPFGQMAQRCEACDIINKAKEIMKDVSKPQPDYDFIQLTAEQLTNLDTGVRIKKSHVVDRVLIIDEAELIGDDKNGERKRDNSGQQGAAKGKRSICKARNKA